MTCEQIIELAKDVWNTRIWNSAQVERLERFYAIAFAAGRQAEREEIALSLSPYDKPIKTKIQRMADIMAIELVEAIRARGDSK